MGFPNVLMRQVKRIARVLLPGYSLVRHLPRPEWPEDTSRFSYQKQFNRFDVSPHTVVLDIGVGGYPFPLATILTDRFLGNTHHRTEEIVLNGKPFIVSDMNFLPFSDKSIDFVYCSHVLEHVDDPVHACSEIVRVGKRGYIEVPTLGKDLLFGSAKGRHKWHVVRIANELIFFEYSERQLQGVGSTAWLEAIFASYHQPMQDLFYNNPDLFNVMFDWKGGFDCIVYSLDGQVRKRGLK